jgi:Dynamin family
VLVPGGDLDDSSGQFADVIAAILALAERAAGLSLLTDDQEGWQDVLDRVDRLRNPSFLIAVCGEFSSGKSTLLGALMRRPELFPDGVGATTAVSTVVRWGEAERIFIATTDHPDRFVISAAELAQYVTEQGNPRNERGVIEVLIELPVPLLVDGIRFVDLPGTGSTFAAHALVTNDYLERIDAALFVTPSSAAKKSEVDFLGRVTARVGDALVIALTKADLIAEQHGEAGPAAAVADLRKKAADRLGVTPESLVIIAVSALNHQLALGDPEEEQASNIPALQTAIETSISARAGSLLAGGALAALSEDFDDAQEYGRERLTALTEGRTPEILKIQADLASRQKWLRDVADREPEWTQRLRGQLDAIGRDTFHELNGRLNTVRSDATAALENSAETLDVNAFTSAVINKVHDRFVESARDLEDKVNDVLDDLARDLKLTLGRLQADTTFRGTSASAFIEPVPARRVTGTVRRYGEAANRAARKSSGWRALGVGLGVVAGVAITVATGGAAAGGLAAVFALATGAAGGAAAGAAVGTAGATALTMGEELAALDRVDPETRRRRLKQHIVDALTPNQSEATDRLAKVTTTLLNSAVAILKRTLDRERTVVTARIKQLNEDLDRTKADAATEADSLRQQLGSLETVLIPEAARLRARIVAEVHSLSSWRPAAEHDDTDDQGNAAP